MKQLEQELIELSELLENEPPQDLKDFGMEHLSSDDFQQIFDFIEILIRVRDRIREDKKIEILGKA